MSRYDGLIIPRSYSEFINKTDAATLLQALQQSGVMDAAPTANSNHPAKSGGIAETLAKYPNCKYYDTASSYNLDCDSLQDRVCLVTPDGNNYVQNHYPAGELLFIYTTKDIYGNGMQKAISWSTQKEWNRILKNDAWQNWYEISTNGYVEELLNNRSLVKTAIITEVPATVTLKQNRVYLCISNGHPLGSAYKGIALMITYSGIVYNKLTLCGDIDLDTMFTFNGLSITSNSMPAIRCFIYDMGSW